MRQNLTSVLIKPITPTSHICRNHRPLNDIYHEPQLGMYDDVVAQEIVAQIQGQAVTQMGIRLASLVMLGSETGDWVGRELPEQRLAELEQLAGTLSAANAGHRDHMPSWTGDAFNDESELHCDQSLLEEARSAPAKYDAVIAYARKLHAQGEDQTGLKALLSGYMLSVSEVRSASTQRCIMAILAEVLG